MEGPEETLGSLHLWIGLSTTLVFGFYLPHLVIKTKSQSVEFKNAASLSCLLGMRWMEKSGAIA